MKTLLYRGKVYVEAGIALSTKKLKSTSFKVAGKPVFLFPDLYADPETWAEMKREVVGSIKHLDAAFKKAVPEEFWPLVKKIALFRHAPLANRAPNRIGYATQGIAFYKGGLLAFKAGFAERCNPRIVLYPRVMSSGKRKPLGPKQMADHHANNLRIIMHEVGHLVDFKIGIAKSVKAAKLEKAGVSLGEKMGVTHDPSKIMTEAIADVIARLVHDKKSLVKSATTPKEKAFVALVARMSKLPWGDQK